MVNIVSAITLSGGSAYGLAAADGVMTWLREKGKGWPVGGGHVVPIVPSAILFDLGRGGKFTASPTAEFGYKAIDNADDGPVEEGNVGAGTGAVSAGVKGGIGTASVELGNGIVVGAIVATNSSGSTFDPDTGRLYAANLELGNEFKKYNPPACTVLGKSASSEANSTENSKTVKNTTIGVVATNLELTKAQAKKVAEMAQDGLARAIRPAHTMYDGDTIFALGTAQKDDVEVGFGMINKVGAAAANALSRAIVHSILEAKSVAGIKSFYDKYPKRCNE